jgi:hypothetical protein
MGRETKGGEGSNSTLLGTKPAVSGAPQRLGAAVANGGLVKSSSDEAGRRELVVELSKHLLGGGGSHVGGDGEVHVWLWVTA